MFKTLKHKVVGDTRYGEFKFRRIDRLKGVERTKTVYCRIKNMTKRKQINKKKKGKYGVDILVEPSAKQKFVIIDAP
jgi:hypothetical protein